MNNSDNVTRVEWNGREWQAIRWNYDQTPALVLLKRDDIQVAHWVRIDQTEEVA